MTEHSKFESDWLHSENDDAEAEPDITAIKEYAYLAFDHLDKNGNGFLERDELLAVLNSNVSNREKSFITFLLNNQDNIAEMVQEAGGAASDGISRDDLESYFALLTKLLA